MVLSSGPSATSPRRAATQGEGSDDVNDGTSCLPVRRSNPSTPQFSLPKLQFPSFSSIPSVAMPHVSMPTMSSRPTSPRNRTGTPPGASSTATRSSPSLLNLGSSPENATEPRSRSRGSRSPTPASVLSPCLGADEAPNRPQELLVLVHGLQGAVEDFTFFEQQLRHSAPGVDGTLMVHATDVNTDKTHDGIDEGGTRLAEDITSLVIENASLTSISMVGFSLGGLYVRFAVGLLFDPETRTIAGLIPKSLVTVASPNLGVRSFGVYRFIPQPLMGASKFLLGKTGEQLVYKDCDENPIMLAMSLDENHLDLPFVSALRAFSKRVLYGNMRQDFMVNWGSSVLDPMVQGISGQELHDLIAARAREAGSEPVDRSFDQKGCKVAFTYTYPPREVQVAREANAAIGSADGERSSESAPSLEHGIAERLQAVGWQVVGIDFPLPIPIAHNRIMAMSRGPIHTWINQAGRRAVRHIVDTLISDYEGHEKMFEPLVEDVDAQDVST